jgi:hypothetical protein
VRQTRWIAAVLLFAAGVAVVFWGRHFDGWDEAWRVDAGVAIGLLAPLYFAEDLLRQHLKALSRTASEAVTAFGVLRRLVPAGQKQTAVLDALAAGVCARARAGELSASDVHELSGGDSDMRAIALAAMQGSYGLIDERVLVSSIAHSGRGFEQFHALKLADEAWSALSAETQQSVVDTIELDPHGYIKADGSRTEHADAIRKKAFASHG